MSRQTSKIKNKVRWSMLYSFSCLRSGSAEVPANQEFGVPGFTRLVFCNQSQCHRKRPYKYPNNSVSTTKYNIATFLPKALFEQFRRVANLYFLLAAVLSVMSLAPVSSTSLVAPLVLVVGISMMKEAVEDWHRFMQDIKVNSRLVEVHVGNGNFIHKAWKELYVGDVVKVDKNEYFPSDLLLLSSSYDDGICYVETMNLDGETNLKHKRCLEVTLGLNHDMEFTDFKATIRCEDPNPVLYSFIGNLEYEDQLYALNPCQVLLRDSKLRNTDYVYGAVIFSGHDTKAIRNSTRSPSKRSSIEKNMDYIIYLLFFVLVLISLVSSVGFYLYTKFEMIGWWYLHPERKEQFLDVSKPEMSGAYQFIRSLILYGYLIPISLYVSIEIVKILQAMLINRDIAMYDVGTNKSAEARTSNLNDELGQVEMILSDKTGTLTCNQMEFRKCSVAGISYGGEVNEVDLAASRRMDINLDIDSSSIQKIDTELEKYVFGMGDPDSGSRSLETCTLSVPYFHNTAVGGGNVAHDNAEIEKSPRLARGHVIKGFNFQDERLSKEKWITESRASDIAMFFRVLALCHTGIPVEMDQTGKLNYEAESPEEVAFLIASQEFGFTFCSRTQSTIKLKEINVSNGLEADRQYKLLNLLEFSSSRKRMSVVVSDDHGHIFLLCKGADSIIYDHLGSDGRSYQEETSVHLAEYAEDGLRTLAIAYRRLEPVEYENWNSIFTQAMTVVGPEREALLESASEIIEKDLILLGVVAIEDKLQKGVPECIDRLAQAGLKIWLLTGDKKETAINIGFSCSLLRHDMKQFHITNRDKSNSNIEASKKDILVQIETGYQVTVQDADKDTPFALIVDGNALEIALQSDIRSFFLRLAVNCASVICCRVSPKQKALIAKLVKEYTGMITLAIGDGANDVGMIQEADIGVGLSGMEGMQAVMASDFSLPQFCLLERLLLVHGHWCYKRIAKMILYFVYKNVAFGLTLFYYDLYSSFSGEILYDDSYMLLFNVVLTSLPVISLGVLEQDVSADVCLQFPALYQQGQRDIYFTWNKILGWILNAIYSSLTTFILNVYIFLPSSFELEGREVDVAHLGAIVYTCIIWTVNCQIALIISHFTWIQHLFIWGSIALWYIFLVLHGYVPLKYAEGGFHLLTEALGPAPKYWLATCIIVTTSLLPYVMHIVIQRLFYPMDDHTLQEMKQYRKNVTDSSMWAREQKNSQRKTHIGFLSRVDAKVQYLKEKLNQKISVCKSVIRVFSSDHQ